MFRMGKEKSGFVGWHGLYSFERDSKRSEGAMSPFSRRKSFHQSVGGFFVFKEGGRVGK